MPIPDEAEDTIIEGSEEADAAPGLARVRRDVWIILRHLRSGAVVSEAVNQVDGWVLEVRDDCLILTQPPHGVDHRWTRDETSTPEAVLAYGLARLLGYLTTTIAERRIRLAIKAGRMIGTIVAAGRSAAEEDA